MQHPRFLTFAVAATAVASSALLAQETSGPFGLHRGMTQAQVIQIVGRNAVKEIQGDRLDLHDVPKPHPAFEFYWLVFSPKDGLLNIVAFGNGIRTNGFGEAVHDSFVQIQEGISKTYGPPDVSSDRVRDGSIWNEPQDWMMGLLKGERDLMAIWYKTVFSTKKLPNRITGIVLEAKASSTEQGFLVLKYEFDGWNEYVEAKNNKTDSVF